MCLSPFYVLTGAVLVNKLLYVYIILYHLNWELLGTIGELCSGSSDILNRMTCNLLTDLTEADVFVDISDAVAVEAHPVNDGGFCESKVITMHPLEVCGILLRFVWFVSTFSSNWLKAPTFLSVANPRFVDPEQIGL